MKSLFSLFALTLLTGLASATPYVVYSGSIVGNETTATGTVKKTTLLYLVTDIADTSSFAVMQVDPTTSIYTILSRPSDSPTTEEANNNFLGSIGTGKGASAVLCYSAEATDSNGNTRVVRAYGTGNLVTRSLVLAWPRPRPLTVNIKTNRISAGTYTFPAPTAAVTTGNAPVADGITGTYFGYGIDSGGSLADATSPAALSLSIDPTLTGLVNIGGPYPLSLTTVIAVLPLVVPDGTTVSDGLSAWLAAFAQANGYIAPSSNSLNISGGSLSLNSGTSGSSLTINGYVGGTGITALGAGTLKLTGTNVGAVTLPGANTGNAFNSVLILGGVINPATTDGTIVTQTASGNSGVTLALNLTASSGIVLSGGTGTIGTGGGTLSGPGGILASGGSLVVTSGTITLTAIHTDTGLFDGTLVASGLGTIPFTGVTLSVNGVTSLLTSTTVGQVITGSTHLSGGTFAGTSGAYTDTGSTISVTTP